MIFRFFLPLFFEKNEKGQISKIFRKTKNAAMYSPESFYVMTPIHYAAASGNSDALRILAPLTTNPN